MFHSLSQLKAAFAAGEISKPDFIEQAHAHFHSILFKYALDMEATDISSILINDRRVVMTTRADGIALIVDPSDHRTAPVESLNFNSYEPCESSIIRSLAPHIDTMLDIGANIGWYSLLVDSINKSSSIHAFEPIPNASIRNLAGREDAQVIECELKILDDFCLDLPPSSSIDFIKCDVEGNELFVLQGSSSVLEKHKPILLVELLRKWCAPFGYHPNEVLELMFDLGYSAYGVNSSGELIIIESISENTIETNFFFVHPRSNLLSSIAKHLPRE